MEYDEGKETGATGGIPVLILKNVRIELGCDGNGQSDKKSG